MTKKYLEILWFHFQHYIHFYCNKVFSIIKSMKILGNSTSSLSSFQKQLLYRPCVLPITLYSFFLQYFKSAPIFHLLKELRKMQQRAVLWITEAFQIFLTQRIEAITNLITIYLHLNKISGYQQMRTASLPLKYVIMSFLKHYHCYKMRVWTDFGQGQSQLDIDRQYYYQSTMDGEHVTWKSCDIGQSSLEQSGRTQGLEGLRRVQRRVRVKDDVKGQEFLMVYIWCIHVQWRLRV